MKPLISQFLPLQKRGAVHVSLEGRGILSGGVGIASPGDSYHWDGLKRGGDPARPTFLFQYTLKGHGFFQAGRQSHIVKTGQAFFASIPSAHVYQHDPACPVWIFFWLMLNESYVVGRLMQHANLINSIFTLPPESPVVQTAAALLLRILRKEALDIYQLEEHLFRWMLECERRASSLRHPLAAKSELLEFVRTYTLGRLDRPFSVSQLSKAYGQSRSNFSHHFCRITGQTPAATIGEIRLEEATRLLRDRGFSVKEIAAQTGFTDSNHLCKSFRRHFHMSPGAYRQMHLDS